MKHQTLIFLTFFSLFGSILMAQEDSAAITAGIQKMSKVSDPQEAVAIKNKLIAEYDLDKQKNPKIFDRFNMRLALVFVEHKNYPEFEKYIDQIQNKFNQTSILSMAASKLVKNNMNLEYANKLAAKTLEIYYSYKDDPSAKPEDFKKADWERFMLMAKYAYYDTYAQTLMALGRYKEALQYQLIAMEGHPEEAYPGAVQRYAKLLALNGDSKGAKEFILEMGSKGRLSGEMLEQLKGFYIAERGSGAGFESYLDSLQSDIRASFIDEIKSKMTNKKAPSFTLKNLKGEKVKLSDYRGKVVVLDLWATWCVPCIKSFPAMKKLVEMHPEVQFLFIAVEEQGNNVKERVEEFINKNGYSSFHVLLDEPVAKGSEKDIIISSYKPGGIPAKYFIDKDGNVRYKSTGFETDTQLINEVEAVISILN